jgi:serine/threonine-protein kinase
VFEEALLRALAERGYRVERRLAESGSYVVYLASRGGERFAVKVPKILLGAGATLTEASLRAAVERVESEAEVLSRLKHPNVAGLVEVVRLPLGYGGYVASALVVEYVDDSLALMVREGRGSLGDYVAILAGAAKALEAAHKLGFCHLDVRPENILVYRGAAKLTDFAGRCDRAPLVIPPQGYAAPEQLEPGGRQGPWTDVYQLALIYARLLLGSEPGAEGGGDLPEPIARALSRDPSARPSAGELARFFEEEGVQASRPARLVAGPGGRLTVYAEWRGAAPPRRLLLSRGLDARQRLDPHAGEEGTLIKATGAPPGVLSV